MTEILATADHERADPTVSRPARSETVDPEPRRTTGPHGAADLVFCLIPAVAALTLCIWFRQMLTSGLWWDEQWRAYHVVLPGLHLDLGGTYSPTSPAWLFVDKFAVVLFGVKEWAFRIPSVVAWVLVGPLTYRLCRRVLGRPASLVVGIGLGASPAILYFGTELKPFATETLATVAIILAWTRAHETEGKQRLLWYGLMALVSLVSVPAIFVVAPLIALDVITAARKWRSESRHSPRLLAIAAATSVAVIVPLAVTVLPQHAGADDTYFNFLPRNFWQAVSSTAHGIGAFLAAAWTSVPILKTDAPLPLSTASHALFSLAEWGVPVLVIVGIWHLRHSTVGLGLTSVLVGGLVMQVVTSLLHLWPVGIARVNLFMLPVVYVLTVAGLAFAWNAVRQSRTFVSRAGGVIVLTAGMGLVGAMLVQNTFTIAALHRGLPTHRWAEDTRAVVADARRNSGPSTIAVVQMDGAGGGFFAEPTGAPHGLGWIFYMDHYRYSARVGSRIPLSRTFFAETGPHSDEGLRAFIEDHPGTTTVVEYAALGGYAAKFADANVLTAAIKSFGFVPYSQTTYADTGELTIWHR